MMGAASCEGHLAVRVCLAACKGQLAVRVWLGDRSGGGGGFQV